MNNECPDCYKGSGWQYPNLGVNLPAGCAWALATANSLAHLGICGFPWVKCGTCNKDGTKPRPPKPC